MWASIIKWLGCVCAGVIFYKALAHFNVGQSVAWATGTGTSSFAVTWAIVASVVLAIWSGYRITAK